MLKWIASKSAANEQTARADVAAWQPGEVGHRAHFDAAGQRGHHDRSENLVELLRMRGGRIRTRHYSGEVTVHQDFDRLVREGRIEADPRLIGRIWKDGS